MEYIFLILNAHVINLKEPDKRLKELGFHPIHHVAAVVVLYQSIALITTSLILPMQELKCNIFNICRLYKRR